MVAVFRHEHLDSHPSTRTVSCTSGNLVVRVGQLLDDLKFSSSIQDLHLMITAFSCKPPRFALLIWTQVPCLPLLSPTPFIASWNYSGFGLNCLVNLEASLLVAGLDWPILTSMNSVSTYSLLQAALHLRFVVTAGGRYGRSIHSRI